MTIKLHNTDDDKNCCSTAEGLMQHYQGALRVWVEVIIFTVPLCVSPLLTHTGGFHQWDSSDCRHTSHQMESCVSGETSKAVPLRASSNWTVFFQSCAIKGLCTDNTETILMHQKCIKTHLKKKVYWRKRKSQMTNDRLQHCYSVVRSNLWNCNLYQFCE